MPESMTNLIQRLEAGTVEGRRELLLQVYETLHPFGSHRQRGLTGRQSDDLRNRYRTMLDLGAYLDAVMMLAPRGWIVNVIRDFDDPTALALAAAILKAKEAGI